MPAPGFAEDEVLRLATSLDQGSEHQLADAIVKAARERGLALDEAEGFESSTGIGAQGSVGGKKLALGKADGGVAMGTGTDVAMNSAQVTLVKGDLCGIAEAREISEETIANMKQNLGFAFVYNALGVPLAAGVLFPFTRWLLSPMIATLTMSLSSVSVITKALRLR